mgnify:CR=1 FL=1
MITRFINRSDPRIAAGRRGADRGSGVACPTRGRPSLPHDGARKPTLVPPKDFVIKRRFLHASLGAVAVFWGAVVGCAGYQIGNRGLFPADIQTVHVPMFESDSLRRHLGERLTEAVCKEIERRTPYKLANNDNADSVLTGRIVGDRKNVLVNTLTGDPRELQVGLQVQVTWVDRRGSLLRDEATIPLPPEVTDISASANLVPEVGQSVATAQQEAIRRIAQQIVNLMETPW